MVFYFTSTVVSPPVTLFMGADKHENEDLIKWGWPEDVWFHVDKVSSAHVYLRLAPAHLCKTPCNMLNMLLTNRGLLDFRPPDERTTEPVIFVVRIGSPQRRPDLAWGPQFNCFALGQTIDDIPNLVLDDACQLVKANSILGNKMNDVDIVYTMWSNLKKTAGMEVGQVAFHKDKDVRKVRVAKKCNEIVNRLNKTKKEAFPDLRHERENRDRLEREDKKKLLREKKEKEKEEEKRKKEESELRSYSTLMKPENMSTNYDGNDSDDFM